MLPPAPAPRDRVSLCNISACPGTHFVDQVILFFFCEKDRVLALEFVWVGICRLIVTRMLGKREPQ